MGECVGTVIALRRFPVKSMQGEAPKTVEIGWNGVEGDRQYGFYRDGDRSRFPWLTGRDVPEMVAYRACYADEDVSRAAIRVGAPDGATFDIWDPQLAERFEAGFGANVGLLKLGRGAFDAMPVSITTTATLTRLEQEFGAALDSRRFRINVTIDASGTGETSWIGRTLSVGEGSKAVRLHLARQIPRCLMVSLDPDSGARDPAVQRTIVKSFDNKLGAYATPQSCGRVSLGDPVYLLSA